MDTFPSPPRYHCRRFASSSTLVKNEPYGPLKFSSSSFAVTVTRPLNKALRSFSSNGKRVSRADTLRGMVAVPALFGVVVGVVLVNRHVLSRPVPSSAMVIYPRMARSTNVELNCSVFRSGCSMSDTRAGGRLSGGPNSMGPSRFSRRRINRFDLVPGSPREAANAKPTYLRSRPADWVALRASIQPPSKTKSPGPHCLSERTLDDSTVRSSGFTVSEPLAEPTTSSLHTEFSIRPVPRNI
jgi:hypothetical protein